MILTPWYRHYPDGLFGRQIHIRSPEGNQDDIAAMVRGRQVPGQQWAAYYFSRDVDYESEHAGFLGYYPSREEAQDAVDDYVKQKGEYLIPE